VIIENSCDLKILSKLDLNSKVNLLLKTNNFFIFDLESNLDTDKAYFIINEKSDNFILIIFELSFLKHLIQTF